MKNKVFFDYEYKELANNPTTVEELYKKLCANSWETKEGVRRCCKFGIVCPIEKPNIQKCVDHFGVQKFNSMPVQQNR